MSKAMCGPPPGGWRINGQKVDYAFSNVEVSESKPDVTYHMGHERFVDLVYDICVQEWAGSKQLGELLSRHGIVS